MGRMKEIATAVATLAIAVGIGFVMQSGETARERYGVAARSMTFSVKDEIDEQLSASASANVLLEVQEIELTSASNASIIPLPRMDSDVQRVSVPAAAQLPQVPEDSDALPLADVCEVTANAEVAPAAMVNLTLSAPCAVNERLTVHHNGMMFTETTNSVGELSVTVPALIEHAVFILALTNGSGAVAQAIVPELGQYERTALQWRGRAGFELHAREFGADYGQVGHVWSGVDQNADGMTDGRNGYMIRLGDSQVLEPLIAEVYTFPSGVSARSGTIDLTVEAEVTAANCGLDVEAQSLEMMAGGKMKTQDLTLSVPGCDAVGNFLVLNNLVSDMKVASN
ncbi:hypothetical protein GCM10007385_04300 [Tateyamaria omphalii]|uniref:hypothetical protein n=1 Tax=Tateyamaria omphalii TaxID=299262 RepID=UPI001676927B|nr:hypothetical protein [Tateyamaria omphalii]GGX40144.1 hypothetical protein GCM10007385_04300 [Tateyamaria omphalii]